MADILDPARTLDLQKKRPSGRSGQKKKPGGKAGLFDKMNRVKDSIA